MSAEGQALLQRALCDFQSPDWETHPDDHAECLAEEIRHVLHAHFMLDNVGPKAIYISEDIWALRNECLLFKKRTRRWNEGYAQHVLCEALTAWSQMMPLPAPIWKLLLLREVFAAAVKFANGRVKLKIRQAKRDRFHGFLRNLGVLRLQDLQKALRTFGIGGRRSRRQQRPAPQLKATDGEAIVGRQAANQAWLRFFGEQQGGTIVAIDGFIRDCKADAVASSDEIDDGAVPTLWEVEEAFRTTASHKAFGLDALPPEVFKANPVLLGRLYMPLFMKCALHARQPSQWRGGILHPAYKGKESSEELANYRSLFVGSIPSKALHRIYRKRMMPTVSNTLHELQCGISLGKPVTLPSLSTHLLVRRFRDMKVSMAAFFLDIKTAYYSTVREIALGAFESDEMVAKVFARFKLPASDVAELMAIVSRGGILSDENVGPHMLAILQDLFRRSWFVTPFTDGAEVSRTSVGTRPGSNFADMIFGFVYHRLWQQIREIAKQHQLMVDVPHNGTRVPWKDGDEVCTYSVPCLDATWADDSVAITMAQTPPQILPQAEKLVQVVLEGCGKFGLTPNLKRGKSALLLALRGPGSRKTAAAHFASNSSELRVQLASGATAVVCVEGAYLHLGTILDRDGKMLAEARRALARAAGAFNEAREKILQNEFLSLRDRAIVFDGLVTATLFNLELWTEDEPSWQLLRDGFHRLQKRLLAKRFHDEAYFGLSHSEVLHMTGLNDLDGLARRKRLGFLAGLVRRGGQAVWAIVQWEANWGRQL